MNIQTNPRPKNVLIAYHELGVALSRSPDGLKSNAKALPLSAWRIGATLVFDADEVQAYAAAQNLQNPG